MLFNSFAFLAFFAGVTLVYYVLPHRWRWPLLLVASYYFYSAFKPGYVLLLLFATVVAYAGGLVLAARPEAKRLILSLGVGTELAVLALYKYADFISASVEGLLNGVGAAVEPLALPRLELLLPAGLSFYVFSCISYMVDVSRGTTPAERHAGRLALYVAFFPKLLAGPIERAGTFLTQIAQPVRFDLAGVAVGLQLMAWGLFKKVVIADRLAVFVDAGFTNPAFQAPMRVLIAVYFYAFQIYCDFSGYSDIAIGAALVLGIKLMENFKRPYLARSVPEFWNNRWHLSLMRWFRDYLYIPLGGSRVAAWRRTLNVMIVFLVSGLWHGAAWTFVIWGGLNGAYQVIHGLIAKPRAWLSGRVPGGIAAVLSILLTFHLITLAWIFFRASSVNSAVGVIKKVGDAFAQLPTAVANYGWTFEHYLSMGLIVVLMAVETLDERRPMSVRLGTAPMPLRWAWYYGVLAAILVIGVWGTKGFVYMQF